MLFYKINPTHINWDSQDSILYFNPRHTQKSFFVSYIPHLTNLKSHIWLSTSGCHQLKWVAISKKALLLSAQSVNKHLLVNTKDRWGIVLPLFHVGGLSILARAFLSRSSYFFYSKRWNAKLFVEFLNYYKITLSSLVPTQVYDIVKENLLCPHSVRAIVVGGETLNPYLYRAARDLNWPLLPSYGLTECGSQVATAPLNSLDQKQFPKMQVLPHITIQIVNKEIVIRSKSLLTGFIPLLCNTPPRFQNPKKQDRYFTQDIGVLEKNNLHIKNNTFKHIKILGEKLNFPFLEEKLMSILLKKSVSGRYCLLATPNARSGFQISLISDRLDLDVVFSVINEFNKNIASFEQIKRFYFMGNFPITGILKVSKQALLKKLGFLE